MWASSGRMDDAVVPDSGPHLRRRFRREHRRQVSLEGLKVHVAMLPGTCVRCNGNVTGLRLPNHVKRASGPHQRRTRLQRQQGQLIRLPGAHVHRNGSSEWSSAAEALRATPRRPVSCEPEETSADEVQVGCELEALPGRGADVTLSA
ncbi:hypothetical protein HPB50_027880 [Hyalomma asiaticum]|nr:hypothetical protein HPB50_027880 [Hyalomma asiaticum]